MLKNNLFHPKILSTLKQYSLSLLYNDIMSGIIVAIIALPLAIAFAIASGVEPQYGIISAIIGGGIISLLGGSRVQIGGPTGAFIVIIYGVVQHYGYTGLLLATMMAGIILILMGLFKIGDWIKMIPSPVVTGFTSGIAVIIFSSQIKDLLGLNISSLPSDFIHQWVLYFSSFHTHSISAISIAMTTIATMFVLKRKLPRLPAAFIAIIVTSLSAIIFDLPIDTIGSRFNSLSGHIQLPALPPISFSLIQQLLPAAVSIAILGAIESLLSAVVADALIGGKHRSNTELIAQGIANVITPFFGGIPVTGAIARTAANIKNGGKTPISGIVHSISLLIIFIFLSKFVSYIPMATLAGILAVVSYNMSEWRSFQTLLISSRYDAAVLLITFFLTIIFDLTVAIEAGLILSAFLFAKRISDNTNIIDNSKRAESSDYTTYFNRSDSIENLSIPENVKVLEIEGAFFFGAASKLESLIRHFSTRKKYLILRMNKVIFLDSTGIKTLDSIQRDLIKDGCSIIFVECRGEIAQMIVKSHLYDYTQFKDPQISLEGILTFMSSTHHREN